MAARELARRVRDEIRYAQATRPGHVAYLGWVGHDNAGDEAMWHAHRQLLAPRKLAAVPTMDRVPLVARLPRQHRCPVLVGGGTLVGNGHFRRTLQGLLPAASSLAVLSVGIEDPAFLLGARADTPAELRRWVPLLQRCPRVRVRGPRSAEILADLGVDAEVVGDPALWLGQDMARPASTGTVAVNVGSTDDQWLDDPDELPRRLAVALRGLGDDRPIRVLVIWPRDLGVSQQMAQRLGPRATIVPAWDPATMLSELAASDLLLGQKLHSVVLAAAVGTPSIALEYRPKCRDFQRSLGREQFCVRTDQVDPAALVDQMTELLGDQPAHQAHIQHGVGQLRSALADAARQVHRELA